MNKALNKDMIVVIDIIGELSINIIICIEKIIIKAIRLKKAIGKHIYLQ